MKVRKEFKSPSSSQVISKVNSKTLKFKQVWDNDTDTAWPLELVWLKPTDDKAFEIIGPMKTISVKGKEKEIEQWYKTIADNIKNVLILTQSEETIPEDAAEKLIKRTGKFTMHSGEIYEGDWNLGRMQGYGISEFQGTCYEGNWLLNMKNGLGKMEFTDGQIYVGEFSNGKPHGKGTSLTMAGDKYEGKWINGKREGDGKLLYYNGDSYSGEWKNNNIEGNGILNIKSMKLTYTGNFVGGKFHGIGTLTTPAGVFVGNFENGKQINGKMEYDNHDFYEGQFKFGHKHGDGKLISQEGIYIGQWAKDLKEGKGTMTYCDGSTYDGNWSQGMKHGKGLWTNANNGFIASYNGDWVYDTREGTGEIVYNTRDKYVGQIVSGQPHGHGKMILVSGAVLEGKFTNGIMEGKIDISSPEARAISVSETGQVVGETEGVEILVPPFLPVLQF